METSELVLLRWGAARALLGDRRLTFRLLGPPYPAIGEGELRLLRIREHADASLEVLCGYEGYRRI